MSRLSTEQVGELLSAYLDGELVERDRGVVEKILREDASARTLLEEMRRTVNLVSSLPSHSAPATIVENVQRQVERSALIGGTDHAQPSHSSGRRTMIIFSSLAAMLAIIIVSGWFLVARSSKVQLAEMSKHPAWDEPFSQPATTREKAVGRSAGPLTEGTASEEEKLKAPDKSAPSRTAETTDARKRPTADSSFARKVDSSAGAGAKTAEPIVDELLAEQSPAAVIVSNSFEREPVQLTVLCKDEATRNAVAADLTSTLERIGVPSLRSANRRQDAAVGQSEAFHVSRALPVNQKEVQTQQFLVRAPAAQATEVVRDVSQRSAGKSEVQLSIGTQKFEGFDPAANAMKSFATQQQLAIGERLEGALEFGPSPPTATSKPSESNEVAGSGDSSMLRGLLRVMGFDERTSKDYSDGLASKGTDKTKEPAVKNANEAATVTPQSDAEESKTATGPSSSGEADRSSPSPERESLVDRLAKKLEAAREKTSPPEATESKKPASESTHVDAAKNDAPALKDFGVPTSEPFLTMVINLVVADEPTTTKPFNGPIKPAGPKPSEKRPIPN